MFPSPKHENRELNSWDAREAVHLSSQVLHLICSCWNEEYIEYIQWKFAKEPPPRRQRLAWQQGAEDGVGARWRIFCWLEWIYWDGLADLVEITAIPTSGNGSPSTKGVDRKDVDGHGSVGVSSVENLMKIGKKTDRPCRYTTLLGPSGYVGSPLNISFHCCCAAMPTQHCKVIERLSPTGVILSSLLRSSRRCIPWVYILIPRPSNPHTDEIHHDVFTIFPSFSLFTRHCSQCSHCSKGIPEGVSGLLGHRLLGAGQLQQREESKISEDQSIWNTMKHRFVLFVSTLFKLCLDFVFTSFLEFLWFFSIVLEGI